MNALRTALVALAVGAAVAGCQAKTPETSTATPPASSEEGTVAKAMAKAARKMQTENITVSEDGRKAEITPAGDLLIDGKAVAIDESQRRLLLDYRARVMDIAQAGMAVGTAGAELAGKAVTEALGSIFSGNPDDVGKRVEAQASGIKAAARKLCDRVPALLEAQRRVAAAIPEFAPFAKMKHDGTDECHSDVEHDTPMPPSPPAPAA